MQPAGGCADFTRVASCLAHRIVYVGGRTLVRESIVEALRSAGFEAEVARSLPEARELIAGLCSPLPAVLLDDEVCGEDAAAEMVSEVAGSPAGLRVGVLSASDTALYPARLLRCGAGAFLTRDTPLRELPVELGRFCDGQLVVDPAVARTMFSLVGSTSAPETPIEGGVELRLTPTERKVMELVAEGLLVKQIALRMDLSPLTVKNHLARIRRRLGATDKAHAVATALRAGLLA